MITPKECLDTFKELAEGHALDLSGIIKNLEETIRVETAEIEKEADKAPWKVDKSNEVIATTRAGKPIMRITQKVYVGFKDNTEANAHLIASAPELLEALEGLFRECSMVHKHWGEGSNQKASDLAINNARQAIMNAMNI